MLTAVEVAELFGVPEREVYGLCASGVLPHYICFDAAEVMEKKAEIERFLGTALEKHGNKQ